MSRRRRSLIGGKSLKEEEVGEVSEAAPAADADPATAPTHASESSIPDAGPALYDDLGQAPAAPVIPHSGDPDSFSEQETQMEDDGGPVGYAEPELVEPAAPEAPAQEWAPPTTADTMDLTEAPTRDEPAWRTEERPMEGALADEFDLYGDFKGLENPPTEEVQLYQDVSQPHHAPMHVPEPPSIPGISDRFTPPPVERSDIGKRQAENRPSYLATPTPAPQERDMFPKAGERDKHAALVMTGSQGKRTSGAPDEDEEPPGMMRYVVVAGVAGLVLLAVLAAGAKMLFLGDRAEDVASDGPDDIRGVKIEKSGVKKEGPEILGDIDGVDDPSVREPKPEGEVAEEVPPAPVPPAGPPPVPTAAPAPAPAPAPVATPKPKPKKAEEPKAAVSKLQIRANRKVLVYVDGKAIGYTPVDYPTTPGAHEIVAMIAGQPATRQTQQASIGNQGDVTSVEFKF